MTAVFVYGLLKPGQRLHHLIESFATRIEPATVEGRLFDAGVPAARFDTLGTIEGFVIRLARPDEALRLLDDVEDEGTLYRRVLVRARTGDGEVDAYAYEYLGDLTGRREAGSSW